MTLLWLHCYYYLLPSSMIRSRENNPFFDSLSKKKLFSYAIYIHIYDEFRPSEACSYPFKAAHLVKIRCLKSFNREFRPWAAAHPNPNIFESRDQLIGKSRSTNRRKSWLFKTKLKKGMKKLKKRKKEKNLQLICWNNFHSWNIVNGESQKGRCL